MSDLLNWADKRNSANIEEFIAKYGAEYCLTAEEINEMRDAVNAMAVIQQSVCLGPAEPTDTPAGTGANYWEVIVPGTYTNFGGMVLPSNNRGLIYRNAAGAYSISYAALDLSGKVNVSDVVDGFASSETNKPGSAKNDKLLDEKIKNLKVVNTSDSEIKLLKLISSQNAYLDSGGLNPIGSGYVVEIYSLKDIKYIDIIGSTTGNLYLASIYNNIDLDNSHKIEVLKSGPSGIVETFINQTYEVTNDNYFLVLCRNTSFSIDLANWVTNSLKKDYVFEQTNKNKAEIVIINNTIIDLPAAIISTSNDKYINFDGTTVSEESAPGYTLQKYAVEEGQIYNIKGRIKGYLLIWGYFNSATINNSNLIKLGDFCTENTVGVLIDVDTIVPIGATYLCVTIAPTSITPMLEITKYSDLSVDIKKVQELATPVTVNKSWEIMTNLNNKLKNQYSQHFIDVQAGLNNRYNFGNINITADFTVPNLFAVVNISVSSTTLLSVGQKICVGTKSFYDVYEITGIASLVISCKLIVSNTNLIGTTLNLSNSITNTGLTITNNLKVFTYDDLMAYHSNEIPKSATVDLLHPNADNYATIGKVIAERMELVNGKPTRVITFGDSFTAENVYQAQLISVLGCTVVNNGYYGARVEHIVQRFLTYFDTYTPIAGDLFFFYMGTNNLADITRNAGNVQEMVYNLSYESIFLDALEKISNKLVNGNWFVCSGHSGSLLYKENV